MMDRVLSAIESQSSVTSLDIPDLIYSDFRSNGPLLRSDPDKFSINPLALRTNGGAPQEWSLAGKRVLLAPACPATQRLLSDPEIQRADWIGFIDRNPIQQGKAIEGRLIHSYEAIPSTGADIILVVPPEKHRLDILDAVARNAPVGVKIAELG